MNSHDPLKYLLAIAVCGLSLVSSAAVSAVESVQFLDMQLLKPGISADQAGIYFRDRLDHIVREHGGNIILVHQVAATIKGEVKPALVASMKFSSIDDVPALFKDPDYRKIVPLRDATFDLPRQSLFQAAPFIGK